MPSLLDIGDLTETVTVRGKSLEVQGISAEGLFKILQEFPELRSVLTDHADEEVLQSLVGKWPDAVAAVIASGTGTPGNKEAEAKAKTLGVSDQLTLLTTIWRLTFPRGIKDFIDALEALAKEVDAGSGKGLDTKSPEQSSGALPTATLQE